MEDDNSTITEDIVYGEPIKFIILLIIEILSLICSLCIIIFLCRNRLALVKKNLHNHFVLLLVSVTLINLTVDLPFTIAHYRLGYDEYRKISFCLWWYWIDYTLLVISIFLTAAASIQRHILIFNAHWFHIRRRRWLLHFLPIIICLFYPALFYLVVIIFYPCDYSNDEDDQSCNVPCYSDDNILFNYDWIINTAFPLTTIIFANITLVIRVIRSMRKIRQRQILTWKRQRKLTLQLFILSLLYIIGWVPSTVISILQSFLLPNLLDDIPQLDYFNYLTYFVCPLQPFICVFSLPELIKILKAYWKKIVHRAIVLPV
ncbi:unnamed protein product [Adineta steineri]|uniref:G-protein coupled receptors family 1 profile domain-containing protein n=1 Tax=Adineta steineri TaxID=433720 RepID=A0A819IHY6_9BILA|nr:unnamed protein product [Adineta steineri]